jgi:extracellular elastinolytic metalloproteinase
LRRSVPIVIAALLIGLLAPAASLGTAAAKPHRIGRSTARASGSFDARRPIASETAFAVAELRARAELGRSLGQGVLDLDPRTGTIRVLARLDGFLTPPSDASATRVVLDYVRLHRQALGLSLSDLKTFVLARSYEDLEGTQHLAWVQRVDGIEAFDNGLEAAVTAQGRLVMLSGSPAHALGAGIVDAARPAVPAAAAIAAARGGSAAAPADSAGLVLFHGARSRLAWRTVTARRSDDVELSVVDATSARILWRADLVRSDVTGDGLAWESYPSTLVGNGGGTQQPVTFPVRGQGKLSGNEAHVYLDVFDDGHPDPLDEIASESGLSWGHPAVLNTTSSGQNCRPKHACTWNRFVRGSWKVNRRQSAVQTYHYLTHFHDHLLAAPIGFTEAAGNFEAFNASGHGRGGDAVQAQVFDGAAMNGGLPNKRHYNNANMFTRPDGAAPVMQMYLFHADAYSPRWVSGNAGDDASIVYHEYTHGLSSRLVTFANGWEALNAWQSASMGEAWSDWYAMDLLVDEGWQTDDPGPGDLKMSAHITGGQGIRYQAIDCTVGAAATRCPKAAASGPGGFTYGDYTRVAGFPEVHSDGEIWAQTLWDLRRRLGVEAAEALVTRGLMLSPPEPSFLDARNAIVQADVVLNGGANAAAIWSVFAHRGMGFFASTTGADDLRPHQDFHVAPDCATDPCGTLKGVVRGFDGRPLGGAVVGLAGLTTGFPGARFLDVSSPDGRFAIPHVPFGRYPGFFVDRRGYDVVRRAVRVDQPREALAIDPARDWAAKDGGATISSFTRPDYSFLGCGPAAAIDRSLLAGWGSDMPGPRQIVVHLPRAVHVTSFGVDPAATCGDAPGAGVSAFDIYTRTTGGTWVLAWHQQRALSAGRLHRLDPSRGTTRVRDVRFVMRENRSRSPFLDLSELSVRGTPA